MKKEIIIGSDKWIEELIKRADKQKDNISNEEFIEIINELILNAYNEIDEDKLKIQIIKIVSEEGFKDKIKDFLLEIKDEELLKLKEPFFVLIEMIKSIYKCSR